MTKPRPISSPPNRVPAAERWREPRTIPAPPPPAERAPSDMVERHRPSLDEVAAMREVPSRSAPPALHVAALVRGGLTPDEALEVLTVGVSAERATDLLRLQMTNPRPEDFGPALLTLRLLMQAREQGVLSAHKARELLTRAESQVCLRPDGMLAPVLDGRPLQRMRGEPEVRDEQVLLNGLRVGDTYHLASGVLYELDDDGRRTPQVVGELALEKGLVGNVLDGIESALGDVFLQTLESLRAIALDPARTAEEAFHAFGALPRTVVAAIAQSPAALERFRNSSSEEQIELVSKLFTVAALSVFGARVAGSGLARAATGVGGGAAALSGGLGVVVTFSLDQVALAHGVVGVSLGLALSGGALHQLGEELGGQSSAAQSGPRERWLAERSVERSVGDPRDPAMSLADVGENAALLEKHRPEVRQAYLRMAGERILSEVDSLDRLPGEKAQRARAAQIRRAADSAGLDIHALLVERRGASRPASLSREAREVLERMNEGAENLRVSSRQVAEEILSHHDGYVETAHWAKWKVKALFKDGTTRTFHWDVEFGGDGRLLFHRADDPMSLHPHLQLHHGRARQEVTRLYWDEKR